MTVTPMAVPDPALPELEPVRARGGRHVAWLAAAVCVLVLGLLVGGLALANVEPSTQAVLPRYAGADTTAYLELRLDLPGDQRQQLMELLGHFPGFGDQAAVEDRIADVFDKLAAEAEKDVRWERDIVPWFGGQVAVMASVPADAADMDEASWIVGLSVSDRDAALEQLERRAAGSDLQRVEHRGGPIWHGRNGDAGSERPAIALTGDAVLVAPSVAEVRSAIDVAAGERPSLADDERFSERVAKLNADRLATFYMDGTPLAELLADEIGPFGPGMGMRMGMGLEQPIGALGGVTVGEIRAEGTHLAVSVRMLPPADGPPLPSNRRTELAARMPADTLAYFETRDTGANLGRAVKAFLEQAAEAEPEGALDAQLETLLGMPAEDFFDFLDDTAVAVAGAPGRFSGGLIATVTDEETARDRLERLVGALRTAAAFGALPVTVVEEQYGAAMLTVIRFDESDGGFMPGINGGSSSSLSFTFSDELLLFGVDDFVRNALDQQPGTGLGSTERYASAVAGVGADNAGVFYVDLAAVRLLVEGSMAGFGMGDYERDLKPYLAPFDRLAMVTLREGEELVSRSLLYVE